MNDALGLATAVPVAVYDGPWTGDGPSTGVGNSPDDPEVGEVEYLTAPPTILYKRIAISPASPKWVDLAGPVYYPTGEDITVAISPLAEMLFEQNNLGAHEPFRLVDSPRALGAPGLITGDFTNLGKA